jgi:hypothetical protein
MLALLADNQWLNNALLLDRVGQFPQ